MTNIFDDETGTFVVVINDRREHSLWPATLDVPTGWDVVLGGTTRQSCLDYIETHWPELSPAGPDAGFTVDHVVFHVADLDVAVAQFTAGYGFRVVGTADEVDHRAAVLRQGEVTFLLVEGRTEDHPASVYVRAHGDGVADIGLRCGDVQRTYEKAVAGGARGLAAPAVRDGVVTAVVEGFGDVRHSLVQRPDDPAWLPGGCTPVAARDEPATLGLDVVDHLAVCLESGTLGQTVERYKSALGFRTIFTERIVVGDQAMLSEVVQSTSGAVTLTLIEPDLTAASGQINDFLSWHEGPGVQHVALATDDIVATVGTMARDGVEFLSTPQTYYRLLAERMAVRQHSVDRLRELNILVDEDHNGQLFQIFARSTHPRHTFFMEVIQRLGARTFGSGNIKALYEAVESERAQSRKLVG